MIESYKRTRFWSLAGFILVSLLYANEIHEYIGNRSIQNEDTRSPVAYLDENYNEGDVILVNHLGGFGFGYYWSMDEVRFDRVNHLGTGFYVTVDNRNIVYAQNRSKEGIRASIRKAVYLSRKPGNNHRVWIVRSHLLKSGRNE